jgi:hypothetical protein
MGTLRTPPCSSLTFDGVVHRMAVTPEEARRWLEGEQVLSYMSGEPAVDQRGRLIERRAARGPARRGGQSLNKRAVPAVSRSFGRKDQNYCRPWCREHRYLARMEG